MKKEIISLSLLLILSLLLLILFILLVHQYYSVLLLLLVVLPVSTLSNSPSRNCGTITSEIWSSCKYEIAIAVALTHVLTGLEPSASNVGGPPARATCAIAPAMFLTRELPPILRMRCPGGAVVMSWRGIKMSNRNNEKRKKERVYK